MHACLCGGSSGNIDGEAVRRPPLLRQLPCARVDEPQGLPCDLHDLVGRRVAAVQALQTQSARHTMEICQVVTDVPW